MGSSWPKNRSTPARRGSVHSLAISSTMSASRCSRPWPWHFDSHQIAAQQQALFMHAQQAAQVMTATAQRLEAQRQAEDVVLQQVAIHSYLQATTLAPVGDWRNGPQLDMTVRGSVR